MSLERFLGRVGLASAPASGATVVLVGRRADSALIVPPKPVGIMSPGGLLLVTLYSSHDSAASGLSVAMLDVDGTYRACTIDDSGNTVFPATYLNTDGITTYRIPIVGRDMKVALVNSANTLTAFSVEAKVRRATS